MPAKNRLESIFTDDFELNLTFGDGASMGGDRVTTDVVFSNPDMDTGESGLDAVDAATSVLPRGQGAPSRDDIGVAEHAVANGVSAGAELDGLDGDHDHDHDHPGHRELPGRIYSHGGHPLPEENEEPTGETGETTTSSAAGSLTDLADFLTRGYWGSSNGDGTRAHNVTNSGSDPNNGVLHYNVAGWANDADGISAERAELVREAFKIFEATLGIDFVETTSQDTGFVDFFFQDTGGGAYAGSSYTTSGQWGSTLLYSYINVSPTWSGGTSDYDDYTLQTILHEIGHALGLGHQGPYNGSASYGTDNEFDNDSWQASMMSYFSQSENTSITASYEFLQTPMSVDWLALDEIYGRQGYGVSNAFTEDTVWGFNTTVTSEVSDIWAQWSSYANRTASTIIDSGGIDTLDLSGYSNNTLINLAPSDAGSSSPSISDIGGRIGNLTMGVGTVIENAIGGAGSETFYGNAADNSFVGNGGNDTFHDSAGSDTYNGGAGTDTVVFGSNFADYVVDVVGGVLQIIGAAIDWVQSSVEWLDFLDQTLSWQAVADTASPNTAPVAMADAYVVAEGAVLNSGNLLDNDTDADGDALSVASVNGTTVAAGGTQITLASGAIVTVWSDGSFEYDQAGVFDTLNDGEQGADSFSYVTTDGRDLSGSATVSITVTGATGNTAPVAGNDSATVGEDLVLSGLAVLANDSDPDGDPLTITAIAGQAVSAGGSVTLTSGAVVTLNPDGTLDYDQSGAFSGLNDGETGTETFGYTVSDGVASTDGAVTITINGETDPVAPVAEDDSADLSESGVATGNVLDNDSDANNDPLSVTAVNGSGADVGTQITLGSGALLTLNADGSYAYDPNGAFDALNTGETATDSFTYTISDGAGGFDTALVTLTIEGFSPPPVEESVLIDFEATGTGPFAGQFGLDFDGLTADATTILNGEGAGNSGSDGDFTITATGEDFDLNSLTAFVTSGRTKVQVQAYDDGVLVGTKQMNVSARSPLDVVFDASFDSVDQVIFSGNGTFYVDDIALVTRSIVDPDANQVPIALDDTASTTEDGVTTGNLLANDSDPDGDPLSLVSVGGSSTGSVELVSGAVVSFASDGSFSYDPNGAFDTLYDGQTATDSFMYQVSDDQGGTSMAMATVTIAGIGTAPTPVVLDFETGLSADGLTVLDAVLTTANGSQAAASTGNGLTIQSLSGDVFDFEGGFVTAGGKGRTEVTIAGYVDDILVASESFNLRAGRESEVALSDLFDAVDEVTISALGGVTVDDLAFFA